MNKCLSAIVLLAAFLAGSTELALAKENVGQKVRREVREEHKRLMGGCEAASAAVDLDVNNVRARIMNGGDMWWDLVSTARYEIPKVDEANQVRRTSLFAGALWIGGLENNNLKLAAMTYRQNGSDFWPGPLDTVTATVDPSTCKTWDKIWEINRDEIDAFQEDNTQISESIRNWPAHGDAALGQSRYLAPFVDVDHDGKYVPENGDYPDVYGDQTLWYVYNDKGNIHSETGADAIGLELQTEAFAYKTNDEINNMTFYTTTITNRSKNRLDNTYFGQWVDADLGYAFDDYVGVDTNRSLGICYNGDNNDEGVTGYGANPPSVGVDFFQGPKGDSGKEIGMSYFVYYNNDFSTTGNPSQAIHYYYYLTGRWKNGDCIKYGGNGFNGGVGFTGKCTKYMFPNDPRDPLPGWSEVTAGNKPGDRRFLQSSGPFSLKPGAKNKVTVGVVWARATTGGATGSLDQLKLADDKAQRLYNNNFKLVDGPDAPDMTVREMDRKLILSLENTFSKRVEKYADTVINDKGQKVAYHFEGYQIYQLKNSTVTNSELDNPDKARLVAQVDVKNGVTKLVNKIFDPEVGADKLVMEVNGADEGIKHTFEVSQDRFASGDDRLVNFKFYYYTVVAYAHAEDPTEPTQYLAGRRNNEVYTGIPHNNGPEFGGSSLKSDYGDGPMLMRMDGTGNGGQILELSAETETGILNGDANASKHPVYQGAGGPVDIKVVDPTQIVGGDYEIRFTDVSNPKDTLHGNKARWYIVNKTTQETVYADTTLNVGNEQLIYSKTNVNGKEVKKYWGLAVTGRQPYGPGYANLDAKNGLLGATITYANPSERWLGGVNDVEHNGNLSEKTPTPGNWIRAGRYGNFSAYDPIVDDAAVPNGPNPGDMEWVDPAQVYEGMLDGIIAPAALTARSDVAAGGALTLGPVPNYLTAYTLTKINDINSVDIVLTPDKSKWSRCMVWEMGEAGGVNEGGNAKFSLRNHAGWNGDVDAAGNPVYSSDPNDRGMSYFPGYAINLETGDRLNVFFGEDSHLPEENGSDMIWNPTSNEENGAAAYLDYLGRYIWGGKHWIYVMNSTGGVGAGKYAVPYDGCKTYADVVKKNNKSDLQRTFSSMMYVMEPMLASGHKLASLKDGIVPNEVRIRIRISKPYSVAKIDNAPNNGLPYYTFSTNSIAAVNNDKTSGSSALDMINIVPNPYYAFSSYENSQLDNRVRLTNLPTRCEISIYTLDGTLVRRIKKDDSNSQALSGDGKYPNTFLDWDLKNQKGIPVASGVYIIHINGYDLGEKVIKWFGVMRPIDLDTF